MKRSTAFFWLISSLPGLLVPPFAAAQVIPDGTTPTNAGACGALCTITGGTSRGSNLFHSFQDFNVNEGQQVRFANPEGIANILSRVTGTNASNILGILGVDGAANLFLLNPNGIIFGPNAQLDIRGSFLASTADSFSFTDGSEFSAVNPQAPPLLAVNVPIGLQYGTQPAGGILSQATLAVDPGQSLALAGGAIQLDGSRLFAPGGRIALGAVGGAGTIALGDGLDLRLPPSLVRADIAFTNAAEANVRADTDGDIAITARNLDLLGGSRVRAGIAAGAGFVGSQAGDVSLDVTEAVQIGEASFISNAVLDFATGNGGNVFINTDSLTISDGSSVNADVLAQGNAGDVFINANSLTVASDSLISADALGIQGNGGTIAISTGSLFITASSSVTSDTGEFAQGNAGDIRINATAILMDESRVSALATGTQGSAGNIAITTGSLSVANNSYITAEASPNEAAASPNPKNAGTITIRATDAVTLLNQSDISAFSNLGNGGDILIETGRLLSDTSDINSYGTGGDAGDITIRATDSITLIDPHNLPIPLARIGAYIRESSGQAGRILIETGDLTLQNYNVLATSGIDPGFPGARSGEIVIRATGAVDLNHSDVSAVSVRDGIGGNIAIEAGSLTVQNLAFVGASGLETSSSGNIDITTGQLSVLSGGQIVAQTRSANRGGDVTIRATDFVEVAGSGVRTVSELVDEPTTVLSDIGTDSFGTADAGNLRIDTRRLLIRDGAQVGASTFGDGRGGIVTVNASESVEITGVTEVVGFETFNSFPSTLRTASGGSGDAGELSIDTERLSIREGGAIFAQTSDSGRGGTVNLSASDFVEVVGTSADGSDRSVISVGTEGGTGAGGSLAIATRRLEARDGGQITVSTSGAGNAGELDINAEDTLAVVGVSADGRFRSAIGAEVGTDATGQGGELAIATTRLNVSDGGIIAASTFGTGNAGNISVNASDRVTLNTGFIASNVGQTGNGRGGNIRIATGDLTLTNGGQLQVPTFGQGDAGNIRVDARDAILLDGVNRNTGFSSALSTATEGTARGQGGDITLNADSVQVANGAIVSAQTFNAFRGGNVTITANTLDATGGGQIITTTDSSGRAGNITLNIADRITLSGSNPTYAERLEQFGSRDADNLGAVANQGAASGLFASTTANSSGRGGTIWIATGQLDVQDGAVIAVNSQGTGVAGDLAIAANTVRLDGGSLTAATGQSGGARGAEITLRDLDLLLLQNGSLISANARDEANGGNITIAAPDGFIVASPSDPPGSDIIANADRGNGGNIDITARSLLGIEFRDRLTPDNDITASSRFGLAGNVVINTPDVDPSQGLMQLPADVVDASQQIAQDCSAETVAAGNFGSFTMTGRGGLPANPSERLESDDVMTQWVSRSGGDGEMGSGGAREWGSEGDEGVEEEVEESASSSDSLSPHLPISPSPYSPIIEAQGWAIAPNGDTVLIASGTAAQANPALNARSCTVSDD
jgi:filamentous hemagglutinin family protein